MLDMQTLPLIVSFGHMMWRLLSVIQFRTCKTQYLPLRLLNYYPLNYEVRVVRHLKCGKKSKTIFIIVLLFLLCPAYNIEKS